MNKPNPTVETPDGTITIRNTNDVHQAFTSHADFTEGDQIDEFTIDTIETELDHHNPTDTPILRAFLYISPLDNIDSGAFIDDTDLSVDGWERESTIHKDDGLGIVYEKRL